jgi:hypothetical protein
MTIAETLGEGQFWKCRMEGCHLPFQSAKAIGHHDVQVHEAHTQEGWKVPSRHLAQTRTIAIERTDEDEESSGQRREGHNGGREGRVDQEERRIAVQPGIPAAETEVEKMEERGGD